MNLHLCLFWYVVLVVISRCAVQMFHQTPAYDNVAQLALV